MIISFKDSEVEFIFSGKRSRKLPLNIHRVAQRKLLILHAAMCLQDLKIPPNNRLEKLKGNRKGQYSIRINDKWRICFNWSAAQARNVEIIDYHK